MFLTEQEIMDTPQALERTCDYFKDREDALHKFFTRCTTRKFTFLGCGSSFMLAKGAAELFRSFPETSACAVPAGDYLTDPLFWREAVRDSIVVALTRSGRTSEIVRAVRSIRESLACPVVSLSMTAGNDLSPLSDLELTMDWCYDRSVCQTRTVTNLYTATLLLAAAYTKNMNLSRAVRSVCGGSAAFQEHCRPILERIASLSWNNVVVLADGPVSGIAEEGALAFTEIAMLTGRYFHLLDYRHGPIVVSGPDTLTLVLLRPGEEALQGALVRDVVGHGGTVVTVSEQPGNPYGAAAHVQLEEAGDFAAWGIPFIYIAQMTALLKALSLGGNPDAPKGLDPYITLN